MSAKTLDLDRVAGVFEEIPSAAWQRGSALAVEMLGETDMDEMTLTDQWRDGRPQNNLLYRYLLRLREIGDAQIDMAFCSVVTEFLASAADGSFWDVEDIEREVRKVGPVAQRCAP
jgi:hypothetical protein